MLHPVLDGLFDYYLAHQDELVKEYNGKVIVLVDNKVVGAYPDYGTAKLAAMSEFMSGTFLLQLCTPGMGDYTVKMRPRYQVDFDRPSASCSTRPAPSFPNHARFLN